MHLHPAQGLLSAYFNIELGKKERIVFANEHFAVLVPLWAVWPNETIIIGKRHVQTILQFTAQETTALA